MIPTSVTMDANVSKSRNTKLRFEVAPAELTPFLPALPVTAAAVVVVVAPLLCQLPWLE